MVDEQNVPLSELVEKYLTLRDRKGALKKKYDEDKAELDTALARCEVFFLKTMNAQGLEALPTSVGVPYKQHRTSAGVGDWGQTLPWIIKHEAWEMLERRVSKEAVEAYKAANDDLPPGITWRDEIVVNVRRKS